MTKEQVSSGTLLHSGENVELKKFLLNPIHAMELTFLGNKYAKTETVSVRPTIQLKYMGKSYRAEQIQAVRNSVALTYRGVSYAKG